MSELRRELNSAVNHNISTNDDRQANAEVVESEIEELDVQRETLALLMLYYCSGLSVTPLCDIFVVRNASKMVFYSRHLF